MSGSKHFEWGLLKPTGGVHVLAGVARACVHESAGQMRILGIFINRFLLLTELETIQLDWLAS